MTAGELQVVDASLQATLLKSAFPLYASIVLPNVTSELPIQMLLNRFNNTSSDLIQYFVLFGNSTCWLRLGSAAFSL